MLPVKLPVKVVAGRSGEWAQGRNLNTEGVGFEPTRACTLAVFNPDRHLATAAEYETRPRGPFPQWGFHHWVCASC